MEIKGREIRNTRSSVQLDEEKRTVEGYAALFNTPSDGLWFGEEVIAPGAFDGVLARSDVFALLNHDQERGILARWKNKEVTLWLGIDDTGLKYRFEAPNTALGDELLSYLRRGEIDESSFAFTVEEDHWEKKEDGTYKRTILKIAGLYDVSPVYSAAYSSTSVYLRAKETTDAIIEEQRKRIDQEEERKKEADLSAYWEQIDKQFNL